MFWQGCLVAAALISQITQPTGYFVMQPVHNNNPPLSDSMLSSPALAGFHVRDKWSLLEPTATTNSFTWIDSQCARAARLHKQVTLAIYAGTNSPSWLGVKKVDGAPLPWDPQVIAAYDAMVADLGQHYANETALAAVHMSSPATYESAEMHLGPHVTRTAGYTDQKLIDVWKSAISAYAAAFPKTALVLDVAMVPDSRGAVTKAVVDFAQATVGERLNIIHCSLKASTSPTAPHQQTVLQAHAEGTRIGFEMVGPSTDRSRFGGSFAQALAIGDAAGASWYQIYQADIKSIPRLTVAPLAGTLAMPVMLPDRVVPEPRVPILALLCVLPLFLLRGRARWKRT